uniref:Coiled-coil domain containing 108 n=1 Tax=Leptobrachium leishanense TaxID=445787 RepID=A0A8C5PWI0_9ANUR
IMGLEVCRSLHWQNWEPGKESIKTLTLKNIKLKVQKVKFSPPSTPFFNTLFPQSLTLMAGTSFSLPVTFRPLEKRNYEDTIVFEVEEGCVSVLLRATLPQHKLSFPEELTMPTCAVYHHSEASFVLRSASDLQTSFRWEVSEPFLFNPASGVLDPRCEQRINVLFQPKMALVLSMTATCRFGVNEEYEKSILITSIAKYPHLVVRIPGDSGGEKEPSLQFGDVAVGAVKEKYIEIHNVSVVDSPFQIEHAKRPSQVDCNFDCEVTQALIPAQETLRIPLHFRPRIVGMESVDYFHVIPVGNFTKSTFKVSGTCQGPSVSLLKSVLNFGLVNLGEQVLRTFELTNSSDVAAPYQLHIGSKESVFSFDPHGGVIGPQQTQTLKVIFSPSHPIPYYRSVACLIHHQEPLFLDLIGTCHSDTDKPAIVLPKHLPLYRMNLMRGLTAYPPDILKVMLQEGKLGTDSEGALMLMDEDLEKHPSRDPVSEFFEDEFSRYNAPFPAHITATTRDFDFGCCTGKSHNASLPLSLNNHTKGKVMVIWTTKPDSPFHVIPECTEIPPLKSTAFTVNFSPSQANTLYAAELEGFIFYKVNQHNDATMCPPWCITLQARGHTFELGHEHFVPTCVLDSQRMVFPPVEQNNQTQSFLLLQNTGPSPLSYLIDHTSSPSVQAKPASGHLSPASHQIVLLRTSPSQKGLMRHSVPIQFNFSCEYTQEIVLFSRAESPQLLLDGDGKLFFKPTCVGAKTQYSYSIKNCSRIPLKFEWKIQHADAAFLSVTPQGGLIRPNESVAQTWLFEPQEENQYFAKTTVLAWAADRGSPPVKKARYVLRVSGEGCKGSLSVQSEQVNLGDVLVGSFQSWDLLLSNDGSCTLEYTLKAGQVISGACDPEAVVNDPVALEIENSRGILPARTKVNIRIRARPARQLQYTWSISYNTIAPRDLANEDHFLCRVTAHGVYPKFSVVDICPAGSARSLNKTQLWRLFSLEKLNTYLERDPTPEELIYRVPTRHSIRRSPTINTPVLLNFNFGAAPVGSEPSVALLMLENSGVLPVTWDFLFPADQQIELEFWAEVWEFDQNEIHQMRIQDNKLFTVSPKSGNLKPGEQCTIQLMYRHDFVGTDRLPILLKVSHGREILLNFIGVTVSREQRYVLFSSTKHQFTPVAIGTSSPKQIYELYNGGAVAVIYEIQLEPLREIQEQNYHHPVFQCLNPRGEIPPGSTVFVEWIFSPLEAKTYSVNVPVHILGGDSALVTFEGVGYDSDILKDSAVFESFSPLPSIPRLVAPGQVNTFYIFQQRLMFGDVPVFCKSSRLLFLNNTSPSESASFMWFAGSPNVNEILQVTPTSGVLQPGASTNVTVTLQTGQQASLFNLDLVCEIFTEKAVVTYKKELQEWEEEEERQSLEFTITEKELKDQGQEIRRYKTLPPIKNAKVSRSPASRNRESRKAEKEAQRLWPKPEPPVPYHLHLSVTGRSHHTADFLNQLQEEFQHHFQYRLLKETEEKPVLVYLQPETGEPDQSQRKPVPEQQNLVVDIMVSIIRNLLDDQQFQEALSQIQNDPIPYYGQLSTTATPLNPGGTSTSADLNGSDLKPNMLVAEEGEHEQNTADIPSPRGPREEEQSEVKHHQVDEEVKEKIRRSSTFSYLMESVLENTVRNIMVEANRGEVVLTSRPRVIALPPVTPSLQFILKPGLGVVSSHRPSPLAWLHACNTSQLGWIHAHSPMMVLCTLS